MSNSYSDYNDYTDDDRFGSNSSLRLKIRQIIQKELYGYHDYNYCATDYVDEFRDFLGKKNKLSQNPKTYLRHQLQDITQILQKQYQVSKAPLNIPRF